MYETSRFFSSQFDEFSLDDTVLREHTKEFKHIMNNGQLIVEMHFNDAILFCEINYIFLMMYTAFIIL